MHDVAQEDGKRLVINNSWGLPQWGTPDGTSLSNQFIDDLSAEGVVFVSSNGNNGDSDFHIEHTFQGPDDVMRSRVQFYPCRTTLQLGAKTSPSGANPASRSVPVSC